ncbi:hypothetical protein FJY84_05695 [Candidatus Bathyarchaeota archaeon]|nr:hypothetical protein [Candidatus Bathyarchaeota archaeon]
MSDTNKNGYILRITHDYWLDQVFNIKKYYSGVMRAFEVGTPILLVKKTDVGDSFIGYGLVSKVERLWEMTPEDEKYSRDNNWKCCLSFNDLSKFNKPYPIKESILKDDPRKGKLLHAAMIKAEQINEIINTAISY